MTNVRRRVFSVALFAALFAVSPMLRADEAEDKLKAAALKLNDLSDVEAMQTKLSELLKDKDGSKKLLKTALKMQKSAEEKKKPFNANASLILAKLAHSLKDNDGAETFYLASAETAASKKEWERTVQAYEGLLDLFWDQKNYAAVEEVARKFIDLRGGEIVEQAKPFVLEKLVQSKAKQGDTDEALRMAEGLVQLDRGGWYFLQLKGWVQREAGKLKDAISTYEEVIEKIDESKGMKADMKTRLKKNVRYLLTGIYVDNKDIDKAAAILEKLIKDDPENPTFYNDLGFILADNDRKLEESAKMIEKAIELDAKQRKKLLDEGKIDAETAKKENAAYLDSLGWILYKQKKYDEAYKYLEKASKDDDEGKHIEIWDHLADCLVAMGKKKEALEIWQKALKFEDVSPRDVERRKKVREKITKLKATLSTN